MEKEILNKKLTIINVGILNFYESLKKQGADVIQVNWRPSVKKDKEVENILSKLLKK
jgi:hypothetical protein